MEKRISLTWRNESASLQLKSKLDDDIVSMNLIKEIPIKKMHGSHQPTVGMSNCNTFFRKINKEINDKYLSIEIIGPTSLEYAYPEFSNSFHKYNCL